MRKWSLSVLLQALNDDIQRRLDGVRKAIIHSGEKGDASELIWLDLLQTYLPKRYEARRAFVVDSENGFSEQIDVVIHDRQYSPFILTIEEKEFVPAESVYAVFEAKQTLTAAHVEYARGKVGTVRSLHRTSLPIPSAGQLPPKDLHRIIGGILTLDSDWNPPLGAALVGALTKDDSGEQLDIGCAAAHGYFLRGTHGYQFVEHPTPTAAFLLELIAMLQEIGTSPMMDVRAYSKWLPSSQ